MARASYGPVTRSVIELPATRWVASLLLRQPAFWALAALLGALWPTVAALSPMGLTTSDATAPGVLYEVAFASLVVAQVLSLALAGQIEWFVKPLPFRRRVALSLSTSTTAAMLLLAAALTLPVCLGTPGPAVWALALTHLHLAGLALILLQLPMPTVARACALPLAAWILPALGGELPYIGPALARVLDAGEHLNLARSSVQPTPLTILPIIGLGLAAWLLEPRPPLNVPARTQVRSR